MAAMHYLTAAIAMSLIGASGEIETAVEPYFGLCPENCASEVVIRRYREPKPVLLMVNTYYLTTKLVPADSCTCVSVSRCSFDSAVANTNYGRALGDAARRDITLQTAGIARTGPKQGGIDLTIDLCPTRRPLERTLFTRLLETFPAEEKPIPLAIAITGVWINGHSDDLTWLTDADKRGDFSITWINHSFSHRFDPQMPLSDNFLLGKGTDLGKEILDNESVMLRHGITPSVFFRFPGLVSDSAVFDSVIAYGLIPVGSDAWLAKGQLPSPGSIVLVHGNGNEPLGIKKFFELIGGHNPDSGARRWSLFDLRESIAWTEEEQ